VAWLASLMLGLYVGIETGYGGFLTAYCVLQLGSTEAFGQYLSGAFWGSIMLARLAAVPISQLLHPATSLLASLAVSVVGAGLMLGLGRTAVGMAVVSVVFGIGLGSQVRGGGQNWWCGRS